MTYLRTDTGEVYFEEHLRKTYSELFVSGKVDNTSYEQWLNDNHYVDIDKMKTDLTSAFTGLRQAFLHLEGEMLKYKAENNFGNAFALEYPFDKDFNEISSDVEDWCQSMILNIEDI